MGLFTEEASEDKLKAIKEKREMISKELALRQEIAREEKLLAEEQKRLSDLKKPRWLKSLR